MKKIITIIALLSIPPLVTADEWVSGYQKSNGTFVQGHLRSAPNEYRYDNRGSQSRGGNQRDELSSGLGATNKSNTSYDWRDNDNDSYANSYDETPESPSDYNW